MFCTLLLILIWIRYRGKVHNQKLARRVNKWNANDVLRVRANGINCATPLVIMSSLYMPQIVKSMVNWNIYNDNIMMSDVAYLKNSRSSLDDRRKRTSGSERSYEHEQSCPSSFPVVAVGRITPTHQNAIDDRRFYFCFSRCQPRHHTAQIVSKRKNPFFWCST